MRRWRNLPFRRGQFFAVPVRTAAAVPPPAWVAPQLRQPRRWLAPRHRVPVTVVTAVAVTVPAPQPRRVPRLARIPRGQFFPVQPAPPAAGTPGPLVPAHLRQHRAQPLRIPRGHRSDPPWQGAAAPPSAIPPQFPRQPATRARLPRRGCIFQVPSAPPGNTSPGPLVIPFLRAAGHRPRWPARPRRGCLFYVAPVIVPPPPFTVGTLTATGVPGSTLTAAGAASALTAATAAQGSLTAAAQTTGGPS